MPTQILIRCGDEEKAEWTAAAEKAGLSLSAWIRSRLVAAANPPAETPMLEPKPVVSVPDYPPAVGDASSKRSGRFDLPGPQINADSDRAARMRQRNPLLP